MTRLRWTLLGSVLCGLAVAIAVALLVPRTEPSAASPGGAPRPAPAGDPARPRVAPARPAPSGPGWVTLRRSGPARIEVRMPDPRGGPPWAIQVFRAVRLTEPPGGGRPHVIGRPRCAVLGRLYRGRFGWIDASNTFRAARPGALDAPSDCGSVLPDMKRRPTLHQVTRITDPNAPAALPVQAVAWGIAGPAGSPRLRVDGRPARLATGPSGTFLAVVPHDRPVNLRLDVGYPGERPVVLDTSPRGRALAMQSYLPAPFRPSGQLPAAGAHATLQLRLPDPSGGLPWGIAAVPLDGGGWCVGALARVVGTQAGDVDYRAGTFTAGAPSEGCRAPTRARPLDYGWSGGGGFAAEPGADPLRGRIARRTLRGLSSYSGSAAPSVREITIATPRDVRTLRPSGPARVFGAVYDGSFPAGRTVLTARMADGSTHREVIDNYLP
jgi:hypothetical protein